MDGTSLLVFASLAAISALAAIFLQEPIRRNISVTTKPYNWGYFMGNTSVALGVTGVAAVIFVAIRPSQDPTSLENSLLGLAWFIAFVIAGVGILHRRKWAWILRICLFPEPISIIVNLLYLERRKEEFLAEAKHSDDAAYSTPDPSGAHTHRQPPQQGGDGSSQLHRLSKLRPRDVLLWVGYGLSVCTNITAASYPDRMVGTLLLVSLVLISLSMRFQLTRATARLLLSNPPNTKGWLIYLKATWGCLWKWSLFCLFIPGSLFYLIAPGEREAVGGVVLLFFNWIVGVATSLDAPAWVLKKSVADKKSAPHFSDPQSLPAEANPPPLPNIENPKSTAEPTGSPAQIPYFGIMALVLSVLLGASVIVLLAVLGAASVNVPNIWDNESIPTLLLGFLTTALIAGNVLVLVFPAISLLKRETPKGFAIASLVTTSGVLVAVSGVFLFGLLAYDDLKNVAKKGAEGEESSAVGTGFFITPDGFFVTCAHVVEGANKVFLGTQDGLAEAVVVATHEILDIALLKADVTATALPLSRASNLSVGERVATMGYPNIEIQGIEPKYAEGTLSALSGPKDDPSSIQISIPLAPGFSGAPIVDPSGNAVGIATMLLDQAIATNVSYATKGELVFLFVLRTAKDLGLGGTIQLPRPSSGPRSADFAENLRSSVALVFADGEPE
jgi:S1-C subfamily serine protease